MGKSKCEGKMSKAQKAAERHYEKIDALDDWYVDQLPEVFMAGAEALLRYAKKKASTSDPAFGDFRKIVDVEVLEEWVKGEKHG